MTDFEKLLSGGDLRSIGKSNTAVAFIKTQADFDELFSFLFNNNRLVVMRAADALEKVTLKHPDFLPNHKKELFTLCKSAENKELRWHLALLLPRLSLNNKELSSVWETLTNWAQDKSNSKIVRVNALQGLFELTQKNQSLATKFTSLVTTIKKENIPSINARIRKLKQVES